MAATVTIGTYTYPQIAMVEDQHDLTANLQERGRFQCDIIDYVGVHFLKGEQVLITDPNIGTVFAGFINTDKEVPQYPSGIIVHTLDCIGMHYLADKRTFTGVYNTSTTAGKIVVDVLSQTLEEEGIHQNFAEHTDSSAADFNQGILSNTQGIIDANGNEWLELGQAGSNVTISETTTATFATGTLTNVQAINNILQPTTVSGLKIQYSLPIASTSADLQCIIWQGSLTIGSSDYFNYSMYIASSSPAFNASLGIIFSDNTTISSSVDQNGISDYSGTDLSNYAKNTWYYRKISLAAYAGKTITTIVVASHGAAAGNYTVYYQNVYLTSGTVFFSTSATTTQTNPIQTQYITGYAPASIIASVIPVTNSSPSSRISTAYNIDPVQLLSSSSISWVATGTSTDVVTVYASYDGGVTYAQCTNNSALPALPPGSNVIGSTLTLQEVFTTPTDPESIPSLSNVQVHLYSAPAATKSDIIGQFATQTEWNTGTYFGLTSPSGGGLTMGTVTSPWLSNSTQNQPTWKQASHSSDISFSISSHVYDIGVKVDTNPQDDAGLARLDWAGTLATTNGISIEFDVTVPSTFNFSSVLIIPYLQTYWYDSGGIITGNVDSTNYGAYTFCFQQAGISSNCMIVKGSNSGSGASTTAVASATVSSNPTHVKITVSSSGLHSVYLNGSGTATMTGTDTTYTSGQVAVGGVTYGQTGGGATGHFKFSNATILPNTTTNGTWLGPATSISSLGIIENSVISWQALNMAAGQAAYYIQTSVDGGSSYQTCTNGEQIPGLTSGVNVSGKSVQVYVWMVNNSGNLPLPLIQGLSWRVLGAYPGSSGTRTTAPLGNDMSITRTVGSGWGTAFDSQTWSQVGTGTTAVASGEETIANTTGDVHMLLGTRTWTDQDATCRFALSASTIAAGIELRYQDTNNFYRLQVTTTTVSIIKKQSGGQSTLNTLPISIPLNTYYRMRFRAIGSSEVTLLGNVWADGTLENTINPTTGAWSDTSWTIETSG